MASEGESMNPAEDRSLPRSIFVREADPRKGVRDAVDSVLSDRFMVFLSLILVPVLLLPFVTGLSPADSDFLEICDWSVVLLFVAEYVSKLYLAQDRWAHFKEPWHLVDLVIVVLPFVQYLPLVGLSTRGSPSLLLRLLRLPRVLAVGGRALGSRIQTVQTEAPTVVEETPTAIRAVEARSPTVANGLTWDELGDHLRNEDQEWIDINGLSKEGIRRLSALLRVPEPHFKIDLVDETFPHIDYVQKVSLVFLQSGKVRYPDRPEDFLTISRSGLIAICTGSKVVSVSRHGIDVFDRVLRSVRGEPGLGFVVSVLYGILDQTLKDYRSLLSEIEVEVIRIGEMPRSKLPRDFLERAYALNREVARLVSNLVHFKVLVGMIISNKVPLEGFDDRAEEEFNVLRDEVTYLNEIADDLSENIRSLIDLYINQTSYETNRILKILAVITSIGVIPSAIGGLLGMNLLDVPYAATLWEVVLVLAIAMAFVSYTFIKLGWLRA